MKDTQTLVRTTHLLRVRRLRRLLAAVVIGITAMLALPVPQASAARRPCSPAGTAASLPSPPSDS